MDIDAFAGSLMPFLRRYLAETALLFSAFLLTAISLFLFTGAKTETQGLGTISANENPQTRPPGARYVVEVSGAVKGPGIYEFVPGSRMKEVIAKAGGLDENADREFFSRNFNLARYVSDQEKIHVPTVEDVRNQVFGERDHILDYRSAQPQPSLSTERADSRVHINSSPLADLITLPGIGEATANKIISNRPYSSPDELVGRKIIKQNVWDQIQGSIDL